MTAWKLAIVLFSAWALIRFWLHPLLVRRWVKGSVSTKVQRVGALAALEMARNVLLRLGVVLVVILLLLFAANLFAGSDSTYPQAVITAVAALAKGFEGVRGVVLNAILVIALLGAVIVLYRGSKAAHARMRQAIVSKIEAANRSFAADEKLLEQIYSDPYYDDLKEQLSRLYHLRENVASGEDPESIKSQLARIDALMDEVRNQVLLRFALRDFDAVAALKTSGVEEDRVSAAPQKGLWKLVRFHVGRMLTSEGMAKDLGLVRAGFDRVATVLLVVSLLSWSSEPLADSFRLAATNLEVVSQKELATRSYEQALSKLPPPSEAEEENSGNPPHDVVQVSRVMARVLADSMVRERFGQTVGVRAGTSAAARGETVRSAILAANAEPVSGNAADVLRAEAVTRDGAAANLADERDSLARKLEPSVQRELQSLKERAPVRWASLARQMNTRYATPMTVWNAQEKVIASAIGQSLDVLDASPGSEISKQGRRIAKEFGGKALGTWVDTQVQQFVARSALESVTAELAEVRGRPIVTALRADSRTLLDTLTYQAADSGPSMKVSYSNLAVDDAPDRAQMIRRIEDMTNRPIDGDLRMRIHGYESLYPSVRQVESATPMDLPMMPSASGSGGVGGVDADRTSPSRRGAPPKPASRFMVAARSGWARGVLFGREVESAAPELAGFRWRANGLSYHLEVLRAGSQHWEPLGKFEAHILNQSLRYAADERVVAVTMVSGVPLARLAIHLHPALIDTALGCRIVEMDRFVDTLSPQVEQLDRDRNAVQAFNVLMTVAAMTPEEICGPEAKPQELAQAVEGIKRFPDGFIGNLRTALSAHPESLAVAESAIGCAASAESGAAALGCACSVKKKPGQSVYIPTDVTSQVREKAFEPTPDFSWMRSTSDRLGHLEFWLHMILSKVDSSGESPNPDADDATRAVDFSSSDLQMLNATMPTLVRSFVQGRDGLGADYDQFMKPIEDFVVLQRFFRIALSSGFGSAFPMEKLVELERATRASVERQTTIRWQVESSEQLQLLQELSPREYSLVREYEAASAGPGGRRCAADAVRAQAVSRNRPTRSGFAITHTLDTHHFLPDPAR